MREPSRIVMVAASKELIGGVNLGSKALAPAAVRQIAASGPKIGFCLQREAPPALAIRVPRTASEIRLQKFGFVWFLCFFRFSTLRK